MELEVLICTIGHAGIERVCRGSHPRVEGVRYIVSWQQPDGAEEVPYELASRDDFRVVRQSSYGLTRNRNMALRNAFAPLVLISDDDVNYTEQDLQNVIDAFRDHPDLDFLLFKYRSDVPKKCYPKEPVYFPKLKRGYYPTSFEMAWRTDVLKQRRIWFDERFGIGSRLFQSGEEDVLLYHVIKSGIRGAFLPIEICEHPGDTTGVRAISTPNYAMASGAVTNLYHRRTSWLRYFIKAVRTRLRGGRMNIFRFIFYERRGAKRFRHP